MILAALLLAQNAPVPKAAAPRPPQDWTALAPLRFVMPPRPDPSLSLFVRGEVAAGRCAAAVQGPEGWSLKVDFAVLVAPDGYARAAVPRAIGCSTVEQFAAGALSRMLRGNVQPPAGVAETWLRTGLTFTWTG